MSRPLGVLLASTGALAALALVWWGWHQSGMALLQLGLGSCL